jgi:hypothetical protein
MPVYTLYHRDATDTQWINCGSVAVSARGVHYIPRGSTGHGTKIPGGKYTAKSGGNGDPDNPAVGDTLFLNGYSAQGQDGNTYTFSNNGSWTAASTTPPPHDAGYFTGATITADDSDWSATGGNPEP